MISPLRLQANRRNALRSTGPRTDEGKQRSRANALRHGLTAETIVPSLEDADDYKAFEATIISDYCAETAVARELVLRLASLLWRLRRATAIETQLFEMRAEAAAGRGFLKPAVGQQITEKGLLRSSDPDSWREDDEITTKTLWTCQTEEASQDHQVHQYEMRTGDYATTIRQLACCFVDCASRDSGLFERLNRYETALWRQALQIIWLLRPLRQS
jgi:hypothetical protein